MIKRILVSVLSVMVLAVGMFSAQSLSPMIEEAHAYWSTYCMHYGAVSAHKHWSSQGQTYYYHYTYHWGSWNQYYYWDKYWGWVYKGWSYC